MADVATLTQLLKSHLSEDISDMKVHVDQITIEVPAAKLIQVCKKLYYNAEFKFEMLMDVCGVDYLTYGLDQWQKEETTRTGFSRGVVKYAKKAERRKVRFAVVYHLLSISHNHRLRLRTFAPGDLPMVDSVFEIWNSADWYEREAFDLYGILFRGHPDLRRILTDYGFIGHPFRKDFPLIGDVEMRYDGKLERCIYEKVSIEPRTLVPKVIRQDNRYTKEQEAEVING